MSGEALRWLVVLAAILVGAGLVVLGVLSGDTWATLVGGVLTGGGAVAARPMGK